MKLIIDIPDMIYNILNGDSSWKGLSIDYILNAVKDGTPLEEQSNRCDSCTHSEEQDGSNCYECVKGMADNFEAQPTEKCKGCYYNDGEIHAECVVCDKEAQPTDAVSREEAIFIVDEYAIGGETWAQRKDCVELLKQLPSVQPQRMQGEWIPTTEQLPDNNQTEYLVTYKRKGKLWINIGFCDDGDWYLYSNDEGPNWEPYVTAWMPLPEPYKREDDEE